MCRNEARKLRPLAVEKPGARTGKRQFDCTTGSYYVPCMEYYSVLIPVQARGPEDARTGSSSLHIPTRLEELLSGMETAIIRGTLDTAWGTEKRWTQ